MKKVFVAIILSLATSMAFVACNPDKEKKEIEKMDKVCGNLTEERFKKMTEAYEAEQATMTERVKVLRREFVTAKEETEGVNKFLRIVRKYTEIAELTPETVREFIDRIIVHEAEKTDGKKRQIVEIYYNCVGVIPNPA